MEKNNDIKDSKYLIELLNNYKSFKNLKNKLNLFHKEIAPQELRKAYNLKRQDTMHTIRMYAIAASIALFIMFGGSYLFSWLNHKEQKEAYIELKEDIKYINSKQKSILTEIIDTKNIKTESGGTCFALSSAGFFITSYHLVNGANYIELTNQMDTLVSCSAEVVFEDKSNDIAILKANNLKFYKQIPYSFSNLEANLGEYVYTLGYPKKDIVFSDGSLSSLSGFKDDAASYQISIPLNPGNSGGPLIDSKGNIIGIISGKNTEKDGASFAIKSSKIKNIVDSVMNCEANTKLSVNYLNKLTKTEQIKTIKQFIFNVKVYN